MEQYLIYLRKSRSDLEAEAHGEGETLSRHEHTLLELAKRQHLNVTDIYREVVSGDTIAARPMMQRVLSEVEQGVWSGVLVMEVERLARGDTIDQGIIAQTFKFSGTKIITPIKTYDPDNEFDEEYFEFGLFMSHHTVRTRTRFFTKKGSGTFFVYRKFCGRTPQSVKRAKAGYHYDGGILPFALRNQVRFVRTWSSPYMTHWGQSLCTCVPGACTPLTMCNTLDFVPKSVC
jgi:hypothetical protein